MKVLFIARHDLYSNAGGDTIQVKSTAKYLKLSGVDVDICLSNTKPDYAAYNLVHLFNIIDPEDLLGHALKCKIPYVVSTIYVNYSEYDRKYRTDLLGLLSRVVPYAAIEYLKTLAKVIVHKEPLSSYRYLLMGHKKSAQYILKNAVHLLPNSHSEYHRVAKDFGIEKPYTAVTNAFDPMVFPDEKTSKITKVHNNILCVARIEGRKNQLMLLKSLAPSGLKLTLIGKSSANQKKYVASCKAFASNQVLFIDEITQPELIRHYSEAAVHILPSWFETTGLSSLEAAAMGCSVVVSEKGDVKEYFGDLAYYCDPSKPESILSAVKAALSNPVNPMLKKFVRENYTWEKAAKQTLAAYKIVLNND